MLNVGVFSNEICSLYKIREHGLQVREPARVYPSKPTCASGQNFGSVRWRDCSAAVWLFGCGIVASIITFCIEILVQFKLTPELRERLKQIKQLNCGPVLNDDPDEESIDY